MIELSILKGNAMDSTKLSHSQVIKKIRERQAKLKFASKELKKHFVGLDSIIDKIIRDIETWFVMPELLTRPVIICLWGATGVGKTDLVRRLVNLLSFHDRFCEIELMNKGDSSHSWQSSISSILSQNPRIESCQPSIILLDEIQNFRTIDEDGRDLSEYKYRDVWTLLSDGKLPFKSDIDYLLQLLWEYSGKASSKKPNSSIPNKVIGKTYAPSSKLFSANSPIVSEIVDDDDDDEDESTSYYTLKHFKNILRLKEPLEEIALWSDTKKKAIIIEKLNDQDFYGEEDYTKALIFISGNLDEAYRFADKAEEVDIDADIFHNLSLKINILDIKKALTSRFKPEQIARFGNNQVIYPSLSKSIYEIIIRRKIDEIRSSVKSKFGVSLKVDKSLRQLIYQNGVFPTQGTRPVFSTISEVIESLLPIFLLKAFMCGKRSVSLFYDQDNICAKVGDKIFKSSYKGVVDTLKIARNNNRDRKVLFAVHEAGHAVVYASLYKLAPPQLTASPASQDIGGFMCVHDTCGSKQLIEDKICSLTAGGEAEKMVFGVNNYTSGSSHDINEATKLAGSMIQQQGMSHFASYVASEEQGDTYNNDVSAANPLIENILRDSQKRSRYILHQHVDLFKEVIDTLLVHERITPKELQGICSHHGLKIKVSESEEVICPSYLKKYKAFKVTHYSK